MKGSGLFSDVLAQISDNSCELTYIDDMTMMSTFTAFNMNCTFGVGGVLWLQKT